MTELQQELFEKQLVSIAREMDYPRTPDKCNAWLDHKVIPAAIAWLRNQSRIFDAQPVRSCIIAVPFGSRNRGPLLFAFSIVVATKCPMLWCYPGVPSGAG